MVQFGSAHKFIALFLLAALSPPQFEVLAKSSRIISGISTTINPTCTFDTPTEEDLHNRVEYGDKVTIKMSGYFENASGEYEVSPDTSEKEVLVGRANIPAFNEHLQGMCLGETRRVMTWMSPKLQAGPVAYLVHLKAIEAKKHLQKGDEVGMDEI